MLRMKRHAVLPLTTQYLGTTLTGQIETQSDEDPSFSPTPTIISHIQSLWQSALSSSSSSSSSSTTTSLASVVPPDVALSLPNPDWESQVSSLLNNTSDQALWLKPDLTMTQISQSPLPHHALILSGSFNPLHVGHRSLLQAARTVWEGRETAADVDPFIGYELSLTNADKAGIDVQEVMERLEAFAGRADLLLTTVARFDEKAALLAPTQITFVVGIDTAVRVLNPKYYGGTLEGLSQAMLALAEAHVSFIVAGRVDEESDIFVSASDITDRDTHPVLSILDQAGYPHMFLPIPDSHFRVDLSSSSLRASVDDNTDENIQSCKL